MSSHTMPCHIMPCDILYLICIWCTHNVILTMFCYAGLPSELGPRRAAPWGGWCRRVQGPPSNWAESRRPCPGNSDAEKQEERGQQRVLIIPLTSLEPWPILVALPLWHTLFSTIVCSIGFRIQKQHCGCVFQFQSLLFGVFVQQRVSDHTQGFPTPYVSSQMSSCSSSQFVSKWLVSFPLDASKITK